VLIDSPAHQFALRNVGDSFQFIVRGNRVTFALVLDCFEFQQTQILADATMSGPANQNGFLLVK
jgi:hypothetical protein